MTDYFLTAVFGVVALASVIFALTVRLRCKKTMNRLDDILDEALSGSFKVKEFDESHVSSIENRFSDFLQSRLTSEENILDEKNKIKEMISDISHQTKTPIANLLLYSELLSEEESLSDEGKESVEMIHAQTEKLRFLVDSLVKLSRLENGIVALNADKNSVNELVNSVTAELLSKAQSKKLKIIAKTDKTDNITADFDMKWTREALLNIVDNAVKYTDEGCVEISTDASDVFVRIDVKDTGIGISEEESSKIFQRFYRATEVSEEEGVGIGLYLAREIIMSEDGYIKLKSVKGQGSTFSIFIPINKNLSKMS
ncbi:MAG: HAMP domain-containing histidine kinase [Clostridia bacterium]|nr:HAMP domain-containing histidine kinase [Clostridia bacterium]